MTSSALRYTGESTPRVEDARVLTGRGSYIDDLVLPGMLHAAFVRSPISHGRILRIDADAARRLPGVVAVITGDEVAAATQPLQIAPMFENHLRPAFPPLAVGKVRHVGDPVAIVVADSRARAEDGRAAVELELEPLEPVSTIEHGLDPARPPLFEDVGTNLLHEESRVYGDPDSMFASAHLVVRQTFKGQRVCPAPMETRGHIAAYDPESGKLTLHVNTQSPHSHRQTLSGTLGLPADRIRVVAPDIGGAFGQKSAIVFREEAATCHASIVLGRPVKSIEDRAENLTVASQAREETVELAAAVAEDGTILALDTRMVMNQGAYTLSPIPSALFAWVVRVMMPGAYRIEHLRWDLKVVATSKASYSAYRGPWAIEALSREALIDQIARELELDPVELRRRNLLRADEQPWTMATGPELDAVTGIEALERAAELIGYDGFLAEQAQARADGRLLGIGFASYVEAAPGPPNYQAAIGFPGGMPEPARTRLERNGRLSVFTSQSPNGQGHETTVAQVAADELGVPFDQVDVVYGDTDNTPVGAGTSGSRAGTMTSGAVVNATRTLKGKVLTAAGEQLEIAPEDLEIAGGVIRPRGVPAHDGLPLAELAAAVYAAAGDEEPDLVAEGAFAQPSRAGWSGGTHVCIVEVDRETGVVAIERYLVVEDCGAVINPGIVDGQIRGGVAQGIGLTLLEDAVYDEDANFLTSTFVDYLLPTTMEIPSIEIEHLHVEQQHEVDFRGVGEGGTVAAPPAVVNAVADALGGARIEELPLTPERVLALIDGMPG